MAIPRAVEPRGVIGIPIGLATTLSPTRSERDAASVPALVCPRRASRIVVALVALVALVVLLAVAGALGNCCLSPPGYDTYRRARPQ